MDTYLWFTILFIFVFVITLNVIIFTLFFKGKDKTSTDNKVETSAKSTASSVPPTQSAPFIVSPTPFVTTTITPSPPIVASSTPLATTTITPSTQSTPIVASSAPLASMTITPSTQSTPIVASSTPLASTTITPSTQSTPIVASSTPLATTTIPSTPIVASSTPLATATIPSTPIVASSTPPATTSTSPSTQSIPIVASSTPPATTTIPSIPIVASSTPLATTTITPSTQSTPIVASSTPPATTSTSPSTQSIPIVASSTPIGTTPVTKINKTTCEQTKELYLSANPDVKKSGMDALDHYILFGRKEGRKWPGNQCRYVTIMYSTWVDHMMKNKKPIQMQGDCPQKCGSGYHWWGKPAYKNGNILEYRIIRDDGTINNELIDYHANLLYAAGIDFITIDLTNGAPNTLPKIFESTHAVVKRYSERSIENTPQIVLWVKNEEVAMIMRYQFYMNPKYNPKIWFNYEGNPLILLGNPKDGNPMPKIPGFTVRRCWGLMDFKCKPGSTTESRSSATVCGDGIYSWTFKQNTKIPGQLHLPFINPENGNVEQMSVCVATQENYMTNANSNRVGRNNGAYFNNQWETVLKYKPTFVLVTAWNEWGSENQRTAPDFAFVDTYGAEYSSDIEPMFGGHADMYYNLMKNWIAKFKTS